MTQEPPFAIQIEPVEGCSLACSFCALQTLRDNGADWHTGTHGKNSAPYRFMSSHTVARIADEIHACGWNPRIELAMHGEPTMHPYIDQIIAVLRRRLPKVSIMLTTNGSGLIKPEKIPPLFDEGLNTLAFDAYEHAPWKEQVLANLRDYHYKSGVPAYNYPDDRRGNPHHRESGKRIVILDDISTNKDGTHQLTNQGGNAGFGESLAQRCAKPFRELSIRWDGNIALCCDDWRGQYKIGNVHDEHLDDLWNSVRFQAARKALYHGRRDMIGVCSGCNVRTYRNGLLPDKLGKETLLPPHRTDQNVINAAQRGKVFSLKLKRGD